MTCNPFSTSASPAVRPYLEDIALIMSGCVLVTLGASRFAYDTYPHGAAGYVLSAIPSFCVFALLAVVLYRRAQEDESPRMLVVRSLLAATFAGLALDAFVDLLRSFGHLPGPPPFVGFAAFWIIFGIAQALQSGGDHAHE